MRRPLLCAIAALSLLTLIPPILAIPIRQDRALTSVPHSNYGGRLPAGMALTKSHPDYPLPKLELRPPSLATYAHPDTKGRKSKPCHDRNKHLLLGTGEGKGGEGGSADGEGYGLEAPLHRPSSEAPTFNVTPPFEHEASESEVSMTWKFAQRKVVMSGLFTEAILEYLVWLLSALLLVAVGAEIGGLCRGRSGSQPLVDTARGGGVVGMKKGYVMCGEAESEKRRERCGDKKMEMEVWWHKRVCLTTARNDGEGEYLGNGGAYNEDDIEEDLDENGMERSSW